MAEASPVAEQLYTFRRGLAALRQYEAADERLVTVYLPPDTPIREAAARLTTAHADAAELPSASTRDAVREAVSTLRDHLRTYETPPSNGLLLAAGVLNGEQVVEVFDRPPAPIASLEVYRDTRFRLEPAAELLPDPTPARDKTLLDDLREHRAQETAASGFETVRANLEVGAVAQLLVAHEYQATAACYACPAGHDWVIRDEGVDTAECPTCGAEAVTTEHEDAVVHLLSLASHHDVDVALLGPDTEASERLVAEFHGVGALLRYPTTL